MFTRITGECENKPTITVEFFEDGLALLYLEGTKPFFRNGLTPKEAYDIISNAGYKIKIEKDLTND